MADQKTSLTGRDVSAPEQTVQLGGKDYACRFDMLAFSYAEQAYEQAFDESRNFAELIDMMTHSRLGALMCLFYGAIRSAGAKMTWEAFAEGFKLTSVPAVRERLAEMISDALPDPEADAAGGAADDPQ